MTRPFLSKGRDFQPINKMRILRKKKSEMRILRTFPRNNGRSRTQVSIGFPIGTPYGAFLFPKVAFHMAQKFSQKSSFFAKNLKNFLKKLKIYEKFSKKFKFSEKIFKK